MKGSNFATFYITILLFTTALARFRKERYRKKIPSKLLTISDELNLCTIEGNSAPFHCFCSDGTVTANVTKAKCWVFDGLNQNHKLWTLFSTQPLITELNIMVTPMGELNFIPTRGLQYLKELRSLVILYGDIDNIHSYAFANLTKIREIILSRNQIVTLSHYAFADLVNLLVLDLNENKISELNRDVFVDNPHLKKLSLQQNNLSIIQEDAFRNLGHLVELDLGINNINVLTKDTFAGLGGLKKLSLNHNKISMLGDLTFAELWILEELDLEANQIEFISDRAFAGLTHLWQLNLSYNKLNSLRDTVLNGIPTLVNFDLRHNNLETFTFNDVKPILHNFYNESSGHLYLQDNNFVCDCRLAWIYILRNETKNQFIRNSIDELTCHLEKDEDDNVHVSSEFVSSTTDSLNIAGIDRTSYDEYNEDVYDYQEPESLQGEMAVLQQKESSFQRLIQIPLSDLPCLEESKPSTETSWNSANTPAYAEINANKGLTNIFSTAVITYSTTILIYLA